VVSANSFPIEPIRNCHDCGGPLSLGAVVCPQCHALVHSEELVRVTGAAKAAEEQSDFAKARDLWLSALPLLPPESTQAEWIRGHAYKLEIWAKNAAPAAPKYQWAKRLGPLAPIAILLAKSQAFLLAIFKLKFLFSLVAFMAIYWQLFGAKFGIGFVLLILLHEMGHYIDIRRRGLPADMPVFLPGLGAYVRWQAMGVTRQTRAEVSLAGPLAGLLGAVLCAVMWKTGGGSVFAALARTSGWLNILNLTPVLIFDGGQAANALNRAERFTVLLVCLLLWLYVHNLVLLIVAAGMLYRLTTKDLPPLGSTRIAAYFIGLLAGLALVVRLIPGQMFAPR